jgi:SET domain-containing protein
MICVPYYVADSSIPGAGKGLFADATIPAGRVLTAPTAIHETVPLAEILEDDAHPHADSSIRWFEEHCTISPEWPDECYINHSFSPNAQWHLGFVLALREIRPGEEILVDYRHLIGPGVEMPFRDALTQRPIVGYSWEESLYQSAGAVFELAKAKVAAA